MHRRLFLLSEVHKKGWASLSLSPKVHITLCSALSSCLLLCSPPPPLINHQYFPPCDSLQCCSNTHTNSCHSQDSMRPYNISSLSLSVLAAGQTACGQLRGPYKSCCNFPNLQNTDYLTLKHTYLYRLVGTTG